MEGWSIGSPPSEEMVMMELVELVELVALPSLSPPSPLLLPTVQQWKVIDPLF